MAFIDFIQKIQKKPRYVRIQILWLSVFVLMFLIVSSWVISLKYAISSDNQETESTKGIAQPIEEIKKEIPSLMETIKASVGVFFEDNPEEELEELEQDKEIIQSESETKEIKPKKLPLSGNK
jgi:hypothetical protein